MQELLKFVSAHLIPGRKVVQRDEAKVQDTQNACCYTGVAKIARKHDEQPVTC